MKRSFSFFGIALSLLLTGCGVKPYVDVDVDSKEYALLQLEYKGDVSSGRYITYIRDYSKGCKDTIMLGQVSVDKGASSKVVKIPVEQPLWISVNYVENGLSSSYSDTSIFVLTPEKNKRYVVDYMRKDIDFSHAVSDFDIYMLEGDVKVDISPSRTHTFNEARECQ